MPSWTVEKSIGAFLLLALQGVTFVIYLDTLLELVKRASEPKMKEPDREFKWRLNQVEQAVKALQRELK